MNFHSDLLFCSLTIITRKSTTVILFYCWAAFSCVSTEDLDGRRSARRSCTWLNRLGPAGRSATLTVRGKKNGDGRGTDIKERKNAIRITKRWGGGGIGIGIGGVGCGAYLFTSLYSRAV